MAIHSFTAVRNRFQARVTRCIMGALLLGICAGGATAAETAPLSGDWDKALAPLATAPVQDYGYVRSVFTFCETRLHAISNSASFRGMGPLPTVLYLMANPQAARTLPLIKVWRPKLQDLYGAKMISLEAFQNQDKINKLVDMIQNDAKLNDAAGDVQTRADHLEKLEQEFAIIPRAGQPGEWLTPATLPANAGAADKAIAAAWAALKLALAANDAAAGAKAAQALAGAIAASAQAQGIVLRHLELDAFYHRYQPFRISWVFYLLSALAFGGSLLFGRKALGWAGLGLMTLGLAEQIVGIASRWILAGRAPLSNMFESFTFAIGGLILVALIFELVYKNRLAGLGGTVLGFIFMVLANNLPIFDIQQIQPLMPALQSSWLTYHVVVIMLSYSAFALSFFVSIAYLVKDFLGGRGLLRRLPALEALDLFNYKIIAVGFPLLTLGIIFGAVWASTAWGRPWGFDPKETWSAITWLIYAIYLHARFLAGWKGRAAAFLALVGFAGVLFTYVGVNYLLHGLHSYV